VKRFLICLVVFLCVSMMYKPVKAEDWKQYFVYVISGDRVIQQFQSFNEPLLGWDGHFFQIDGVKMLNCSVQWDTKPIPFDPRVVIKEP